VLSQLEIQVLNRQSRTENFQQVRESEEISIHTFPVSEVPVEQKQYPMANFTALPREIKHQIWNFICEPRRVEVRISPHYPHPIYSVEPVPPILQVAREWRDYGLCVYVYAFGTEDPLQRFQEVMVPEFLPRGVRRQLYEGEGRMRKWSWRSTWRDVGKGPCLRKLGRVGKSCAQHIAHLCRQRTRKTIARFQAHLARKKQALARRIPSLGIKKSIIVQRDVRRLSPWFRRGTYVNPLDDTVFLPRKELRLLRSPLPPDLGLFWHYVPDERMREPMMELLSYVSQHIDFLNTISIADIKPEGLYFEFPRFAVRRISEGPTIWDDREVCANRSMQLLSAWQRDGKLRDMQWLEKLWADGDRCIGMLPPGFMVRMCKWAGYGTPLYWADIADEKVEQAGRKDVWIQMGGVGPAMDIRL
jgi:hypothetical protein